MSDVFISYARSTADRANAIAAGLRSEQKLSVWLDQDLQAHRAYSEEIEEQLDAAKAVIVIWSKDAAQSQWVRSEANRARESFKLVQLRIDATRLPMPFDQIECADLSNWAGIEAAPAWHKILASIAKLTGAEPGRPSTLPATPAGPSVTVLPFKDLSPARDQDYLCSGTAEEIVGALTRLPGLRVAGTVASGHGNRDLDHREIAQRLQVGAYLEGSVRTAGDRVRIAVRLIQSNDGFVLWSQSFDRDLSDIFAIQDEIALAIVAALGIKLLKRDETVPGQGGTSNPKAAQLYLKAHQLIRLELETERRTAAELLREAVRIDPAFAIAFAALGDVLVQIARHLSDRGQASDEAIQAAAEAVRLAPLFAEAHLAHGAALHLRGDPQAAAAYQRALELGNENANVHYRISRYLVLEGRKVDAIRHYERAFELAPDDYRYIVYAIQEYQALGDQAGEKSCLQRSAAVIAQHLEFHPADVRAFGHGAGVMALLGHGKEAQRYIDKALALRPDDHGNLVTLACAAMLNKDANQALDLLERAVGTGRGDREWMLADNDLKPLHGDLRFEALIQRLSD